MRNLILAAALLAVPLTACDKKQSPPGTPLLPTAAAPGAPATGQSPPIVGTVLERIDAPSYSYLRLQTATGEEWAAVPETAVEVGSKVEILQPALMQNFESRALQRTFERVYFGVLEADSKPAQAVPAAGGAPQKAAAPAAIPEVKVERAEAKDAKRIAEVYAERDALDNKPVTVRGQVVKFNSGIMGRNWIHLRDGSGSEAQGDHDLTVTTDDIVELGEVVIVHGVVKKDRDFGHSYQYPVIVEQAEISR
jgi:hypothetical protein